LLLLKALSRCHLYREQRRRLARIGRKGVSTNCWIVGGTRGVVLNKGARLLALLIVGAGVQEQRVDLVAVHLGVQRVESIQRYQLVVIAQLVRYVEYRQFVIGRLAE